MAINTYEPRSFMIERFIDHAQLGLSEKIEGRTSTINVPEKIGNHTLWIAGIVPRTVKAIAKSLEDPRIVTVALTVLSLIGTSFAFYPATTVLVAKYCITAISPYLIPFWAIKFAAYINICTAFVGYGFRAAGRFGNSHLMREFYGIAENKTTINIHPQDLSVSEIIKLRAEHPLKGSH